MVSTPIDSRAGWVVLAATSIACGSPSPDQSGSTSTSSGGSTSSVSSSSVTTTAGGGGTNQFVAQCSDGWCLVPAGTFVMGSPEDEPGHLPMEDQVELSLTRDFRMMQHEVTLGEWASAGFSDPTARITEQYGAVLCGEPDCPVAGVLWWEALAYANVRSVQDGLPECYDISACNGQPGGEMIQCSAPDVVATTSNVYECQGYRLPTEAEWEYAARAGTGSAFPTGEVPPSAELSACGLQLLDVSAWYCATSGDTTHVVGAKMPNALGLFDMLGNAEEWVSGVYTASGGGTWSAVDPDADFSTGHPTPALRVFRGGGFSSKWRRARLAARAYGHTDVAIRPGLRLVRTSQ